MVLVAAGTWLVGCGDDGKPPASGGKGGTAGMAGSAGAATGGTGGSAGSPAGGTAGSAGSALGGSAGTAAGGTAGSAGTGTAGTTSAGGEGGDNQAGGGGTSGSSGTGGTAGADQGGQGGEGGEGGEGGASASMCSTADLDVELVSATGTQRHDHLPINGNFRTTLLSMINTGSPLTFTLPPEGTNVHDHTLTFTARQLATLRDGGALNITTAVGGVMANRHTHTYAIDCEP